MAEPFVAEIRIFPFNFAPTGWAFCDGQLLPLSQNTALYSLLGVTYGGNGISNFALPNLQGCVPMMWGQGQGLSLRDIGEQAGEQALSLLDTEIPNHTHTLQAFAGRGTNASTPSSALTLSSSQGNFVYGPNTPNQQVLMNPSAITVAGSSVAHNNLMPALTLNFCIALQGIFPPRS
jgi:microcystin-dependent protein